MTQQFSLDALLASFVDEPEVEKVASEKETTQPSTEPVQTAAKELEDLLTKQADEVNTDMSNVEQKGRAIADAVLGMVKQAIEGGNNVVVETAVQAAQSSAGQAETPRQGATITQTLKGLVANGLGNGAVRQDAMDENVDKGGDEASVGGAPAASNDEVEKAAAVSTLVQSGIDFDQAVDMVKVAAEQLEAEEGEQIKQAAVAALVNEGMDIESAVVLVKQAMELDPEAVKNLSNGDTQTEPATPHEKVAAAIEALVGAGYTVAEALQLLDK